MPITTNNGFPHACGDVPTIDFLNLNQERFSPRMWGCSAARSMIAGAPGVFPTHVGMFRDRGADRHRTRRFPHACGDVPSSSPAPCRRPRFSPRMWGCSAGGGRHGERRGVFPTHVGMFRSVLLAVLRAKGFPHACGDVPRSRSSLRPCRTFSPRMWGCSGDCGMNIISSGVFPTHVGMFR